MPAGRLVGRDAELTLLAELLPDPAVRLTTLTGPPGVGKTRLALAAAAALAEQFADGAVFVDLTTVRDPDLVPAQIAAALGRGDPELLLVLDNLEHVLPAAAPLGELLADRPRLTVLSTSRERLHLRAEREVPVPPLALPGPAEVADPERLAVNPAVALLLEQVRGFAPGFSVTAANREALAEICARLDGLPLALELAAPRLRLFDPAELLFRIRHRVGSLASDARDVPDRHRTLHAALKWSHDLLGAQERAMFRQLSVFVGGWTLDAAEHVCTVDDVVPTTASLVDKSLIRRAAGRGGVARFTMLESLREFAGEQLERAGETAATRARHARYFTALGGRIEARVGTADEWAAIEEVGLDVGNLREAHGHLLASGRAAEALPLASGLGWYCYTRGQLGEGQFVLERTVAAAAGAPKASDEALVSALVMAGAIAWARGDVERAEKWLVEGLRANERVGSVRLRAIGTAFLGHVARVRGRAAEAVARHEEAGRLHEQLANVPGIAWSRYDLGLLARQRREPDRAAALLCEALRAFRDLDYAWAIACTCWALGTVQQARGRLDEAAALIGEALARFEEGDDLRGVAQCLEAAADIACAHGAAASAAPLLGAATTLRARLAAPLPVEEQGIRGAVELRLRHALGVRAADDAANAGRAMSTTAALALAREVLSGPRPAALGPLTRREQEVALLVRHGRTNRQIGRQLGISEKTAEVHVHNIIRKLGASSRVQIAAWVAARDGGGA
jgi:non-specific serine/threonine protein kinase